MDQRKKAEGDEPSDSEGEASAGNPRKKCKGKGMRFTHKKKQTPAVLKRMVEQAVQDSGMEYGVEHSLMTFHPLVLRVLMRVNKMFPFLMFLH